MSERLKFAMSKLGSAVTRGFRRPKGAVPLVIADDAQSLAASESSAAARDGDNGNVGGAVESRGHAASRGVYVELEEREHVTMPSVDGAFRCRTGLEFREDGRGRNFWGARLLRFVYLVYFRRKRKKTRKTLRSSRPQPSAPLHPLPQPPRPVRTRGGRGHGLLRGHFVRGNYSRQENIE